MEPGSIYGERYKQIIQRLARARADSGLTQADLASAISLGQPEVSKIENCQRQISIIELLDWVKVTRTSDLLPVVEALEPANGCR